MLNKTISLVIVVMLVAFHIAGIVGVVCVVFLFYGLKVAVSCNISKGYLYCSLFCS